MVETMLKAGERENVERKQIVEWLNCFIAEGLLRRTYLTPAHTHDPDTLPGKHNHDRFSFYGYKIFLWFRLNKKTDQKVNPTRIQKQLFIVRPACAEFIEVLTANFCLFTFYLSRVIFALLVKLLPSLPTAWIL